MFSKSWGLRDSGSCNACLENLETVSETHPVTSQFRDPKKCHAGHSVACRGSHVRSVLGQLVFSSRGSSRPVQRVGWLNQQTIKSIRYGRTKAARSKRPNTMGSKPHFPAQRKRNTTEMAKQRTNTKSVANHSIIILSHWVRLSISFHFYKLFKV